MTPLAGASLHTQLDVLELNAVALLHARRVATLPVGDPDRGASRERLVQAALPLAARLARRYHGRGEPLEDLEQVARVGLLKAIDRYDPERGAFTAFASVTIRGELRRHFRDRTWGVHVPRRMQELSLEVSRAQAEMTSELRRPPTINELAERLQTGPDDILAAQETLAAYAPVSLNSRVRTDSPDELSDQVGDRDGDLDSVEDRLTVGALLCRLPDRERRILAMRFYGNNTQMEIAVKLGISQMHVSRLLSRALTWLREAMLSDAPLQWQAGPIPSEPQDLMVRTRVVGTVAVVEVAGEVDRDTAGQLRDTLLVAVRRPVRQVCVNLTRVPLMDAAGIAALLVGLEAARGADVRLRFSGLQPHVLRALRAVGIQPLVEAG